MYVPEGVAVFTATLYHTAVVSFVAVAAVVFNVCGDAVAGTGAYLTVPIAALLIAEVGPAPKPPRPSTRKPHVFAVKATGEATVLPVIAGIELPPDTSAEDAAVSLRVKVYPAELFVLTVTVSLAVV